MTQTFRAILLCLLWCLIGVAASAVEQIYRSNISYLENPQRNLQETVASLQRVRDEVQKLRDKPVGELTDDDRRVLAIDEIANYVSELEGHFGGTLEDPEADELPANERKIYLRALFETVTWWRKTVNEARNDIILAKYAGTTSRYHPNPAVYPDREPREPLASERAAVLERITAMIPLMEAKNYEQLILHHFSFPPNDPPTADDMERILLTLKHSEAQWTQMLAAYKLGEGKGYTLSHEDGSSVFVRPIATTEVVPNWRYVQFYFRAGVPGCALWNWN